MPVESWQDLAIAGAIGGLTGFGIGLLQRSVQSRAVVWTVAGGAIILYVCYRQGYIRIQTDIPDGPPISIWTGLLFFGGFIIGNGLA